MFDQWDRKKSLDFKEKPGFQGKVWILETLDFGDCPDFGDFHFLCFEGCYEIRGKLGPWPSA